MHASFSRFWYFKKGQLKFESNAFIENNKIAELVIVTTKLNVTYKAPKGKAQCFKHSQLFLEKERWKT